MSPRELYEEICRYDAIELEKLLCNLHHPCDVNHGGTQQCLSTQSHSLKDFDHVKVVYCQVNNIQPELSSPDGVCVNDKNERFFFVEIKSWKNVIAPPDRCGITEKADIDAKATKYAIKLRKKWIDGQKVCCGIVKNDALFATLPLALIFVTDIETQNDGIASFASNINALAAIGDNLEVYCNEQMKDCLDKQLKDVPVYYISCRHFDTKIANY